MNILGNRIKKERENLNLSRNDLAKKIGVSYSAIAMYEQGNREPSNEILLKMCKVFNCTTDYLMGKSNYKTSFDEFTNAKPSTISLKDYFGDGNYLNKKQYVLATAWLYNQSQDEKNPENLSEESKLRISQIYNGLLQIPEARKIIDDYNNSFSNNSQYKNEIYHDNSADTNYVDIFDAFGFELTRYERDFILDCIPNESIDEYIRYFDGT